jgi:hypothetical protein
MLTQWYVNISGYFRLKSSLTILLNLNNFASLIFLLLLGEQAEHEMSVGPTFNYLCHILETLVIFLKYTDDYKNFGLECLLLSNQFYHYVKQMDKIKVILYLSYGYCKLIFWGPYTHFFTFVFTADMVKNNLLFVFFLTLTVYV